MSKWRESVTPEGAAERPELESVLAHYGVDMRGRQTGMTQCPLHEDKTPSLSVDLNKQLWNCHSCGEAGDSYKLIMQREKVNFTEAKRIAQQFGTRTLEREGLGRFGRQPVRQARESGGAPYSPSWRRDS